MKKPVVFLYLLITSFSAYSQSAEVIRLPQLMELLSKQNDTTYILNFWATWCKPCVKELPSFDSLHHSFQNSKTKIVLISLDNVKELNSKVKPFLEQRKTKPEVLLLNETDYNKWIDLVEPSWGGAIPATLIFNHQQQFRKFIEGETEFDELKKQLTLSHNHSSEFK